MSDVVWDNALYNGVIPTSVLNPSCLAEACSSEAPSFSRHGTDLEEIQTGALLCEGTADEAERTFDPPRLSNALTVSLIPAHLLTLGWNYHTIFNFNLMPSNTIQSVSYGSAYLSQVTDIELPQNSYNRLRYKDSEYISRIRRYYNEI
jgi:hypothetical protein